MSVLIIDAEVRDAIKEAVERARDRPVPWEVIKTVALDVPKSALTLTDRKANHFRPPTVQLIILDYRCSISFEQQPCGLVRHLSISVKEGIDGRVPHPVSVQMIAQEFGINWPPEQGWNEEFEPGRFAVNLIQVEAT